MASVPAAPPSWLPHSRGPPPVHRHQAHSKHLLPCNTVLGSSSPQTSCLLGYEHPHGSAYWDPSVKSPQSDSPLLLQCSPSSLPTTSSAQLAPAPVTSHRNTHLGASCQDPPSPGTSPHPSCPQGPDTGPLGLPPSSYR